VEVAMMLGFQCGEFSRPVYFGLRVLKRDILRGATGRDALSVAILAASHLYRQPGGGELLQSLYRDLQTTAPSEMVPLFSDRVHEAPGVDEMPSQTTKLERHSTALKVADEPTEVVILRREIGLNGERFAPGRYVVPSAKAAALRALDTGR
jgi:hypothetical protein